MATYIGIVMAIFTVRLITGLCEIRDWPGEMKPESKDALLLRAILHLLLVIWGLFLLVG
jgi:hypothetical protein